MTTTVGHTLDIARTELGYHEDPPGSNHNKFSKFWGHPPEPWCADFACWVLQKAGNLDVPMSAYTPTLAQHYKDRDRWHAHPKPGDLVFFDFIGRISHVGIVEHVRDDGSIVSLEGNTDEAGGRTGGKVMRHVRRANIVGYGRPHYRRPAHPVLRNGDRGPAVGRLQRALNQWARENKVSTKPFPLDVDNQFGDKTEKAVATLEAKEGLTVNGIAGHSVYVKLGLVKD